MKNPSYSTLSDEELVRLFCATNSTTYFEALYYRYNQKVYRMCWQLTKNKQLAQDYAHDVFIQVLLKLAYFQGRSAFTTWLYTLTRNYCISKLRSKRHQSQSDISLEEIDSIHDDYQEFTDQHLQLLSRALTVLSAEEANLVIMKYYQGLEVTQISEQLTISVGAVKMRLKRSREKLRKQIMLWAET